jgi:hypothetical protein
VQDWPDQSVRTLSQPWFSVQALLSTLHLARFKGTKLTSARNLFQVTNFVLKMAVFWVIAPCSLEEV